MKHPSTEELLLLSEAEGAADQETTAHLEACAACRATLGELMGVLTAATSQLRADVADPSAAEDAVAWARLDDFLAVQTLSESDEPVHLGADELLLSVDGELGFEREAHLNACGSCSAELLRTHQLLAEIELELRGSVEDDTPAQRAEALATLRERLSEAPAKVIEFPAAALERRTPVWQAYAAAAALGFLTFGGLYYSQIGEISEPPAVIAEVAEAPPAQSNPVAPLKLTPEPAPAAAPTLELVASAPQPFAAPVADRKAPGLARALEAQPLELAASVNAPEWTPEWQSPTVPSPILREQVQEQSSTPTAIRRPAPTSIALGDRVVGGVVRTALLAHYRDAARRSFQAPEPTALEGELARFVTGVYRNQSELLRHAYELNRLAAADSNQADAKQRSKSANRYLRKVGEHERAIFAGLSETLPRKFWATRTDAELPESATTAIEAQRLLDDALQLEETLTTLFNRPSSSVDASLNRTPGELLDRIQTRIRRLRGALDTL